MERSTPVTAFLPRLDNIVAFRIAKLLLKKELDKIQRIEPLEKTEKVILNQISQLDVPASVAEKVSIMATAMFCYMQNYDQHDYYTWPLEDAKSLMYLKHAVWRDKVSINHEATVRALIYSDLYGKKKCYKMACENCLVTEIVKFAPKESVPLISQDPLAGFWTLCKELDMRKLKHFVYYYSPNREFPKTPLNVRIATKSNSVTAEREWELKNEGNEKSFQLLLQSVLSLGVGGPGVNSAFRYFWRKLDSKYKFEALMDSLENNIEEEVDLRSLLLELNEKEQQGILEQYGEICVMESLNHPLEVNSTLEMAYRIKNSITLDQFIDIMCCLTGLIKTFEPFPSACANYIFVLRTMLSYAPLNYRQEFVVEHAGGIPISTTQTTLNAFIDTLKSAFDPADKSATIEVASSNFGRSIFGKLIIDDQLDKLQFLLPADIQLREIMFANDEKCEIAFAIVKKKDDALIEKFAALMFSNRKAKRKFFLDFPETVAADLKRRSEGSHKKFSSSVELADELLFEPSEVTADLLMNSSGKWFDEPSVLMADLETLNEYVGKCRSTDGDNLFKIRNAFEKTWPANKELILKNIQEIPKVLSGQDKAVN